MPAVTPTRPRNRIKPFNVTPDEMERAYSGLYVPDIIEFVVSDKYLNKPRLYPRQATILKTIFLQNELMTDYDFEVLDGWVQSFENTGNNGISPDIFERMAILRADGWPYFHEVIAAIGRRGSKGYLGALCASYVTWNFLAKPMGPQQFYGIDENKQLVLAVFAGKKEQAKQNQWMDIYDLLVNAPCYRPYLPEKLLGESLSILTPMDKVRANQQAELGIYSGVDIASFRVDPLPSTLQASRGPTGYCLDPKTRILTADLEWVPISTLKPGDSVVGIDEQAAPGKQRRLRKTEVVNVWKRQDPAFRITFDDGTSVIASGDHRWLVADKGHANTRKWRFTKNLTLGSKVCHLVDPWNEMEDKDAGYLAGIYDGEGCIVNTEKVRGAEILISQNPGAVLDHTLELLRKNGFTPQPNNPAAYKDSVECQQWSIRGIPETMRFLAQTKPLRLFPKHSWLWDGMTTRGGSTPNGRLRADGYKYIESIESLPEQDLIDIETTTHTFIAEGFISHNCQLYDEMAHVIATGANRSAGEIYNAAKPALDQFKKDGFIYEPSSTWQKVGKFYENYVESLKKDDNGLPLKPEQLMFQLTSWDPYVDHHEARNIPLVPGALNHNAKYFSMSKEDQDEHNSKFLSFYNNRKFTPLFGSAPQEYDEQMQKEQSSNPESFAIERLSYFATVQDAYLRADHIERMFAPFEWNGETRTLHMSEGGALAVMYKAHGDPSKSNANFGFAIAHVETAMERHYDKSREEWNVVPVNHCIFDVIHRWRPEDFPDHQIDYIQVEDQIFDYMVKFMPHQVSFDQFNTASPIQRLNMRARQYKGGQGFPKQVNVVEVTATAQLNWKRAEQFKTALGMNWIHAPWQDENDNVYPGSDLVSDELSFLQEITTATLPRVEKQSTGPVTTKDVADCLFECVHYLIGEQVNAFRSQELGSQHMRTGVQGGAPLSYEGGPNSPQESNKYSELLTASSARGGRFAEGMGRRPNARPGGRMGRH
jgi:hypothetical protein